MRGRAGAVIAAALALAGCARLPIGHHVPPRGGETITYELRSIGFCIVCSSYAITLGPDGQGIFTGERNTAVMGDRRFRATPEQVHAFNDQLRDYRPNGEMLMTGPPTCKQYTTDQNTVDVRWQAAEGARHLTFYGGCDLQKNRKMASALFSAPSLLPIADLIGKHGS